MSTVKESQMQCEVCGGKLIIDNFMTKKCSCCNKIYYIQERENINSNILNDANDLRKCHKFNEALHEYDRILAIEGRFPEANWGAFLSKYGVNYVFSDGKAKPSIHKLVTNSKMTDDKYAIALLENTVGKDHEFYQNKINELEELRAELYENLKKESSYQVFICCKNKISPQSEARNELGYVKAIKDVKEKPEATKEFKLASRLYRSLSSYGLKVFFEPMSVAELDENSEAIVYNALKSSKYLIILAENLENLTDPYVMDQWQKFIKFMEEEDRSKKFNLVYGKKDTRGVPNELVKFDYFTYDDKDKYFSNIYEVINNIFSEAERKPSAGLKSFFKIDLRNISRDVAKKLDPIVPVERSYEKNILNEPDRIDYIPFVYEANENSRTIECIKSVKSWLTNGNYANAAEEIDMFERCNRPNYEILLLKLLVMNKSKSVKELLEENVHYCDKEGFSVFNQYVANIPEKKLEEELKPFADFILDSIRAHKDNNSDLFYAGVCRVNCKLIYRLNSDVFNSLVYLRSNEELLAKYLDISLPIYSSLDRNPRNFINYGTNLALDLCEFKLFDLAKRIVKEVLKLDPQYPNARLAEFLIKRRVRKEDDLFPNIEEDNDPNHHPFKELDDLVSAYPGDGTNYFSRMIKRRLKITLQKDVIEYDDTENYLDILMKLSFDDRDDYFNSVFDMIRNDPNTFGIFNKLLKTLGEDRKEDYLYRSNQYIKMLISKHEYGLARELCRTVLEYFPQDIDTLSLALKADTETPINQERYNIERLKDFRIIEKIIINSNSSAQREMIFNNLFDSCMDYLTDEDNEIKDNDGLFEAFDQIVRYALNINEEANNYTFKVLNIINTFAQACREKGLFDRAYMYYQTTINNMPDGISTNKTCSDAYFGLVYVELKCKSDEEVLASAKRIDRLESFQAAKKFAPSYVIDNYTALATKQQECMKQKKRPIKIAIISGAVAVVALIIIGILIAVL